MVTTNGKREAPSAARPNSISVAVLARIGFTFCSIINSISGLALIWFMANVILPIIGRIKWQWRFAAWMSWRKKNCWVHLHFSTCILCICWRVFFSFSSPSYCSRFLCERSQESDWVSLGRKIGTVWMHGMHNSMHYDERIGRRTMWRRREKIEVHKNL